MINLLSKEVYNRISAGEVVERPASVVKELVENAVDAGAKEITVCVDNGGIERIFVMDNGCGIEKDDMFKAYLPHATSKLSIAEDLDKIETLGFRGEALASIAAVSECLISSKTVDEEIGYKLSCKGGVLGEIEATPCLEGTAVTVRNLFFNTPARLKFLKTARSEESEITDTMEKLIISNPYIAFKYKVNEKMIFQSYGEGLKDAIMNVYGAETVSNCYEIFVEKHGIAIEGFLGNTNFFKGNRSYQTIIVNGRYVTDNTISTAVHNAYQSYLMKRQYPFYVLSVSMPSEFVDVNVHPRKAEVRFQNNQIVYGAIYSAVSKVLDGSADALELIVSKPQTLLLQENFTATKAEQSFTEEKTSSAFDNTKLSLNPLPEAKEVNFYANQPNYKLKKSPVSQSEFFDLKPVVTDFTKSTIDDIFKENKAYIAKLEKEKAEQQEIPTDAPVTVIGQALSTFLILECGEDLIIIDQHAAHERILYDKFCEKVNSGDVTRQSMLFPYSFKVNAKESDILFERVNVFREIGIELEAADETTFNVYALPVELVGMDLDGFFADILNDEKFKTDKIPQILKEKLMQKACKSAIKSGDKLSESEINGLLSMLKQNWGLKCPHGRPVCVKISRTEIDKWFKRIV